MWHLSSSSAPEALAIVDGTGPFEGRGPHYSRRNPGSRTFTGVGQEVVLVSDTSDAVWAVVRQRTPSAVGTGASRGRSGDTDERSKFVWRNMLFRNLGSILSSKLIISATELTYRFWLERYGEIPSERLRTEIDIRHVQSRNPGYCYLMAGWERGPVKRHKRFFYAPLVEL